MKKKIFEQVYKRSKVIWTELTPPKELVRLIQERKIKPCKVLDVGCGEGYNSIYLASKGFDVFGIDISKKAIQYAKENAKKAGVKVRFKEMRLKNLNALREKFDFVLEWSLLHFIPFDKREEYICKIHNLLTNGGRYLSVCFNNKDPHFGKTGARTRVIPKDAKILKGETLYFSSLDELNHMFKRKFRVLESKMVKLGKLGNRAGNFIFMKKSIKKKVNSKEISKKMTFAEILEKNPECGNALFESGLHCIGCGMAMYETLEEGCKMHGFTNKQIDALIKKLNRRKK